MSENKNINELMVAEESAVLATPIRSEDFLQYYTKCGKLAEAFSKSTIIPQNYQGNKADCTVAIDMANRMGVSPMMVMQNLYVVKGKPSWSGQACTSFIRSKFTDVKTIYIGEQGKDTWGCYVTAKDKDGETLKGATVTIAMAKSEGWYGKSGSKWQTMPELMLAYRAAAFFARVHCPEILMGCQVQGEAEDMSNDSPRIVPDVL